MLIQKLIVNCMDQKWQLDDLKLVLDSRVEGNDEKEQ